MRRTVLLLAVLAALAAGCHDNPEIEGPALDEADAIDDESRPQSLEDADG